ncbi:hypothetical protein KOI35_21875 [Actinoplanes bogorensis]|uniref:Uncharacterized protein n=1 Tax=Paractinoplanes bogorensis TaxID=1610840 RepID=A0ABS5YRS0_9ACTN|nr:hypothetical protein [Actinoplanes bogorensis]MBU2666152.1 hypothetical protein [Actinoplanes bogorensis]
MRARRHYRYVGPAELRDSPATGDAMRVETLAMLAGWVDAGPCTFVVAPDGQLRLASRHSEHVALAGGHEVLAAGEMTFGPGPSVVAVTNQSTGYCPDPDCWPAVAEALDRLDVPHPGGFTDQVVFRLCPACGERNLVRDHDFTCALCDTDLPAHWNFAPGDA